MNVEVIWSALQGAEAILFEATADPEGCHAVLRTLDGLRPTPEQTWRFDMPLSVRWRKRVYATTEFSAFYRVCAAAPAPKGTTIKMGEELQP